MPRPVPPTDAPSGDDSDGSVERPTPFAFLADRDAFLRRYILSLVLAPPPSRGRRPPGARPR